MRWPRALIVAMNEPGVTCGGPGSGARLDALGSQGGTAVLAVGEAEAGGAGGGGGGGAAGGGGGGAGGGRRRAGGGGGAAGRDGGGGQRGECERGGAQARPCHGRAGAARLGQEAVHPSGLPGQ